MQENERVMVDWATYESHKLDPRIVPINPRVGHGGHGDIYPTGSIISDYQPEGVEPDSKVAFKPSAI